MVDMEKVSELVDGLDPRPPMADRFYSMESLVAFDVIWDCDNGREILEGIANEENT